MRHRFQSFWYGGPLSSYEQFCLRSFVDCGYDFDLYTYDLKLAGPAGVQDFATLCRVTSSFICDLPEAQVDEEFANAVRDTFNGCLRVNDARVRLVHGTWDEGGASHISRTSFKPTAYFKSKDEIARNKDLRMARLLNVKAPPL